MNLVALKFEYYTPSFKVICQSIGSREDSLKGFTIYGGRLDHVTCTICAFLQSEKLYINYFTFGPLTSEEIYLKL